MIPATIHDELDTERKYQLEKGREGKLEGESGWSYDFDNQNTVSDWASYINIYLGKAVTTGCDLGTFRDNMIKVATLACAAIESIDRNQSIPPRHFDDIL